jgi:hypothetical protein
VGFLDHRDVVGAVSNRKRDLLLDLLDRLHHQRLRRSVCRKESFRFGHNACTFA